MTRLNLRRLQLAHYYGDATKMLVRLGLPALARQTARIASRWAFRALQVSA